MVGGGRDGVGSFRNHAGAGNVRAHFAARKVPADTGLCTLPHFDFNCGCRFQIVLVNAEPAGGHLHDGICAVAVEVLVEAAFAGIVTDIKLPGGAGEAGVRVVADGTVAHGGKQNGDGELQLGIQPAEQGPVRIPLHPARLLSQKNTGFHGLAQRIDRRVCDLRGIDQQPVPIDGQGRWIPHGGQQHAAAAGLLVDLADGCVGPVGVFPEMLVGLYNL